jgi:HEPN domain-containing protein
MLVMLNEKEFIRWIKTAKHALESAKLDKDNGYYNWACFKAQQAAELATKAYFYGIGEPKIGHSIAYLLLSIPNVNIDLINKAKFLDKMYIPTRYPNSWHSGTPDFYYTLNEAEQAINYAKEIIDFVEEGWKQLSKNV